MFNFSLEYDKGFIDFAKSIAVSNTALFFFWNFRLYKSHKLQNKEFTVSQSKIPISKLTLGKSA